MVALENVTAFSMDVKSCQKSGPRLRCPVHVDEERHPVVPWEGLHAVTMTSVDGKFPKEICLKACPQKVTGSYRVVNETEHQNKWPNPSQCSFAKPQAMDLSIFWLALITLNSTILILISEGKLVDPSPA